MADFPNVYSCGYTNTAGTAPVLHSFGFLARFVRVDNLSGSNLFLNVNNNPASTSGFYITSCAASGLNTFQFTEPGATQRSILISGISVQTTSTSAGAALWTVLALG